MKALMLLSVWMLLDLIRYSKSNDNSFDYLINGDATAILEKLKQKGVTIESIFSVRNSQEMMKKKDLPYLGPWIKKTINFEFQEKNPRKTFQQVVGAADHLKVSGLGCKKLKCKKSVQAVGRTYDDLVKVARSVSSESVRQTIQMLQFIRDGVKDSKKRDSSLNKCLPIAEELAKNYGRLVEQANILQKVAYKAVMEIEKDNLQISRKEKEDEIILDKLKRILDQAKRIEEERCNSKAMTSISDVLGMIGGFKNNLDKDFETALKAMSAASVSMKIVKTMALDIQEFWEDQALLIRKIVEKNVKLDGFLLGIDGLQVNIAEVGLYWLVFGTISVTADNIMVQKYGKLQPVLLMNRKVMFLRSRGPPSLTIDSSISSHVFGVIYFKMNKGEKRKIAAEGSKIITASKAVIDKLNKNNLAACACWYRSGEGVGQQVFIGTGIEQNDCEKKCRDRKVTSRSINGVAWEIKGKRCYCKKDMKEISGNAKYKSCFLKVDGSWASWGSWGTCRSGNPAMRTRKRSCYPPKAQRYGGRDCLLETDAETRPCPIDGNWGSWGSWGTCSKTCGAGIQTQRRSCSPPKYRRYGGRDCSGRESDSKTKGCRKSYYCPGRTHQCTWLSARYGRTMYCPSGYVATGACGSGKNADCGKGVWTKLRCCKVDGYANSGCTTRSYRYGRNGYCPSGKFINSLCGSGKNGDCGRRIWFKIGCCAMSGYTIKSQCSWKRGGYGSHLQCPNNYVMVGRCGSGKNADCPGKSYHGIYCCAFRSNA